MSKRVTIIIDNDIDKKVRNLQAKVIGERQTSYSYSRTINDQLRKILK